MSVELGVFNFAVQDVQGKERGSAYIEFMKHRKMGNWRMTGYSTLVLSIQWLEERQWENNGCFRLLQFSIILRKNWMCKSGSWLWVSQMKNIGAICKIYKITIIKLPMQIEVKVEGPTLSVRDIHPVVQHKTYY